jgi:hypothetical protein
VQENSLAERSFAQIFRGNAQVEIRLLVDDGFSSAHNALHKLIRFGATPVES